MLYSVQQQAQQHHHAVHLASEHFGQPVQQSGRYPVSHHEALPVSIRQDGLPRPPFGETMPRAKMLIAPPFAETLPHSHSRARASAYGAELVEYLVDNSQLQAQTHGLGFRRSKEMHDLDDGQDHLAHWGSSVRGQDEGNGWLRVGHRYLPMVLHGAQVLSPAHHASGLDSTVRSVRSAAGSHKSSGSRGSHASRQQGQAPRPPPTMRHSELHHKTGERGHHRNDYREGRHREEYGDGASGHRGGGRRSGGRSSGSDDSPGKSVRPLQSRSDRREQRERSHHSEEYNAGSFQRNANERPPEMAQFQCGETRLQLRQEFNCQEISVQRIMCRYDTNGDYTLERDEFRHLLQDYNRWFKHITDDELQTLMRVVDRDHNGCIEPAEVMYALKVWYAYVKMPKSVGLVLAHIGDRGMPSVNTLQRALAELNDKHPVRIEEAQSVQQSAFTFGGDERHVDANQLRMAVATWYLHIERKATATTDLVKHSANDVHANLAFDNPIQRLMQGKLPSDTASLAVFGVWIGVCIVMPIAEMWAGNLLGGGAGGYEYWWCRILAKMLRAWGFLVLLQSCLMVAVTASWECKTPSATRITGGALGIVTLALLCLWILGTFETLTSPPSACGLTLWNFSYLAWVLVPFLVLFFACCGLPCLYCTEYMHNRQTDMDLMERRAGGSGE